MLKLQIHFVLLAKTCIATAKCFETTTKYTVSSTVKSVFKPHFKASPMFVDPPKALFVPHYC
jgi:hypothetical protein